MTVSDPGAGQQPTSPTVTDLAIAERVLRPLGPHARMSADAREQVQRVAEALAAVRATGYSEGLVYAQTRIEQTHAHYSPRNSGRWWRLERELLTLAEKVLNR